MFFDISTRTSCTPKFWHMYMIKYGNFMVTVNPWRNFFSPQNLTLEHSEDKYLCYFIQCLTDFSSVFDVISSGIDEVLPIKLSANVNFGDFNVYHKDCLT